MLLGTLQDKLIAGGLAAALAISVGLNIKQAFDKRDLDTEIASLDRQINDPDTGFIARLAQCRSNVALLEAGISEQNTSIAEGAAKQAQAMAQAARVIAAAERRAIIAERKAEAILSYEPKGDTTCERMLDLDRQLVETVR